MRCSNGALASNAKQPRIEAQRSLAFELVQIIALVAGEIGLHLLKSGVDHDHVPSYAGIDTDRIMSEQPLTQAVIDAKGRLAYSQKPQQT